tara:strand:- start:84 stop:638 length:555 start_codon:yes stop_codon:yes gene_type:complete
MNIGVTGSLSSGKSSVVKLLAKKNYKVFSADKIVKSLYRSYSFKRKLKKKFKIEGKNVLKEVRKKLSDKSLNLKFLGNFIQPMVRKKMVKFLKNNKTKNKILEIPLLVENRLMKYFDIIILVSAPKNVRLKRYLQSGGKKFFFDLLDKNQITIKKKVKYCDFLVVNNNTKKYLSKRIDVIMNNL